MFRRGKGRGQQNREFLLPSELLNTSTLKCQRVRNNIVHYALNPDSSNQRRKEQFFSSSLSQHSRSRKTKKDLGKSFRAARVLFFNIMLESAMGLFLKPFNLLWVLQTGAIYTTKWIKRLQYMFIKLTFNMAMHWACLSRSHVVNNSLYYQQL